VLSPEYGVLSPECGVWNSKFGVRNVPHSAFRIRTPQSPLGLAFRTGRELESPVEIVSIGQYRDRLEEIR
jgi:hypothetical protein